MKDFTQYGRETTIRVNVPSSNGFYRLRCEAFFTVSKGQFTKMIKALKADNENAADNAYTLFDFVHYMRETHHTDYFKICPDRIVTINNIWNPDFAEDTREQKRINKNVMSFCAGKNDSRPVLRKPFESDGILYATDSYIAVRLDNRNNYTGDYYGYQGSDFPNNCSAPNMGRLFLDNKTVMDTFTPVTLPSVSVFETWTNKGKVFDKDGNVNCIFQACGIGINAAYIYKCLLLTDSNILYVNPVKNQPCYIIGNGFTCIVLPVYDTYKDYLPSVCMYQRGNNGETVIDLTNPESVTIPSEKTRKTRKQNNVIETAAENNESIPAGKERANYAAGAIVSDTVNNNVIDSRNPDKVYKIAGIEYTGKELETIISDKKYIVNYRTVYGIERTKRGYNAVKLAYLDKKDSYVPIIARGYHVLMTLENVCKTFPCFPTEFYNNDTVLLTVKPSETVPGNNDNVRQAETAENSTEDNDSINTKGIGKPSENQRKTGITEDIETGTASGYPVSENMSKCTNCTESNNIEYLHKMNNSGNPGIVPYTESAGVQVSATDTDTFPSALSALENPSAITEETENPSANPHEVPADDHGYSMESFNKVFCHMYNHLYNAREYHADLVNRFDHELNAFEVGLLKALAEYRQDFITSDREAAAFCMALDRLEYVEKKVPENTPVPLDTEETGNNIAVSAFNSIPETMNTDTVIPDTETRVSRMTAKNGKYQPVPSDTVIHSHCQLPSVYTAYTPSYGRNNTFCDIRNGIGPPG